MSLTLDFAQLQKVDKVIERKELARKQRDVKARAIWDWVQNLCKTDTYNKLMHNVINLYKSADYRLTHYRGRLYGHGESYNTFDDFLANCREISEIYDHIDSGSVYSTISGSI